jgi:hypothetical protein
MLDSKWKGNYVVKASQIMRNIFFLDVANHVKVEKQSITYMNNERLFYDLAD